MASWTIDDPGAGDTGAVSAWASSAAADDEAATGITSVLNSALGAVASLWTGTGAEAWTHTMSQQKTDVTALHGAATGVKAAAQTYASQVADIQRRTASQIAALGTARIAAHQTYLDDASDPPSDSVLRGRARDHADALSQSKAATSALKSLADERQSADDAFIKALRRAVPSSWPAERAAFSALGIRHPERVTESQIDRRVAAYLDDLAKKNDSDYTTSDATVLVAFAQRGDISAQRVVAILKAHPGLAGKLKGVDPNLVASWWRGMDDLPKNSPGKGGRPKAQQALIAAIPEALGNLDGVAYWARDQANRSTLRTTLAATEAELKTLLASGPPVEPALQQLYLKRFAELTTNETALKNVRASLGAATAQAAMRQLVSLTNDVPPLAAVSVGNLDTAANVTYMVPGMGSSSSDATGWADASQNVWSAQSLARNTHDLAVVAWLGYKSPSVPSPLNPDPGVLLGQSARAGSKNFEQDLAGFNATRVGSQMSLNVVSHSYGTTTASLALAQRDLHVDSFVSVASAGIEKSIPNAKSIHATHVFAEQARNVIPGIEQGVGDEYAWVGREGSGRKNPMDPDFGAHRFNADGDPNSIDSHGVTAHDGLIHSEKDSDSGFGYFDIDTESLSNIALATTDQGDQVSKYRPAPLTPIEEGVLKSLYESRGP